ncbi:MAG: diphosphomevalonate decarboxylase, partial [Woeseiaceae bacterium]
NDATLSCLYTIRELQSKGVAVFFTIDAGPQVKAFCTASDEDAIRDALRSTRGVIQVLQSGLGDGAAVTS